MHTHAMHTHMHMRMHMHMHMCTHTHAHTHMHTHMHMHMYMHTTRKALQRQATLKYSLPHAQVYKCFDPYRVTPFNKAFLRPYMLPQK